MTQVQTQIPRVILTMILDRHSITYNELIDGSIIAEEQISFAEPIQHNVTNWNMRELKEWLGY